MRSQLTRTVIRILMSVLVVAWLGAPGPAAAGSRPHFVHWMSPGAASETSLNPNIFAGNDGGAPEGGAGDDGGAPEGGAIPDGGDGGFSNVGRYIPWNGGPVITQLSVVAVIWGSSVDPQVVSRIGSFYSVLTTGSFMHYVSEYQTPTQTPGAPGTVAGTFTIVPNNASPILTDSDVVTELSQQIAAGALPPADPNTVFMVHLPPGVSINDPQIGQSCVPTGFCAYHKSSMGIIYAVLPDFSQGGCAPGPVGCTSCCGDLTAFDDLTAVASHELLEVVTDPLPFENPAWLNVLFGETGDLCQYARHPGGSTYTTVTALDGTKYTAQKGWSNAAFLAHFGNPDGCVDYPTTLCCNDSQPQCSWLPNGSTACPNPTGNRPDAATIPNGIVVSAPTVGGFGSGLMSVQRNPVMGGVLPLGVTDWLSSPSARFPSPTFGVSISNDVTPLSNANACFAFVTNATQGGIFQCVPDTPSFPCTGPGRRVEQTPSGPMCCVNLPVQQSADGKQLCAKLVVFGTTPVGVPAIPRRNAVLCGALLLGVGLFAKKRGLVRKIVENKS